MQLRIFRGVPADSTFHVSSCMCEIGIMLLLLETLIAPYEVASTHMTY